MNARVFAPAGLCLVLALAGCITTADRSGDRALENGFLRCEGLALKRIVTSPAAIASAVASPYRAEGLSGLHATAVIPSMLVWGCVETGEELVVGLAEALSGTQFKNCAYPTERFRFDAEGWQDGSHASKPVRVVETKKVETKKDAAKKNVSEGHLRASNVLKLERQIAGAAAEQSWPELARLCRLRMAACVEDNDRIACGVRLAVANWNAGDRVGAVIAADMVVSICSRKSDAARREAEAFRTRLRNGDAPQAFPAADILPNSGIAARIVGP